MKRVATGPCRVVGIAGGSCSGKTTLVRKLRASLDPRPAVLSFDAYYLSLNHLPLVARHDHNFDHPDSLDVELFLSHLRDLKAGRGARQPVYDFASHTRAEEIIAVESAPVVLVEGILLLHFPDVVAELDHALFIDASESLRLERRIRRDTVERGRTEESVLRQFGKTVAPMHRLYVQPGSAVADRVIRGDGDLVEVARELALDWSDPER